jgi:hypothetical protein
MTLPDAAGTDPTLLRIVCAVAWADGDFSTEERDLLERLQRRYADDGLPASLPEGSDPGGPATGAATPLEDLVAVLRSEEDRELALKLSYMMIRVGRRAGDEASINAAEKRAYRHLVELLALPEERIAEIEWAAGQELARGGGLRELLLARFLPLIGPQP